jgi:hypothetical protein
MKKIHGIIPVAVLLCISGCATLMGGKDYNALAKEKSFEAFFPAPTTTYTFKDLDEAYDFVNTAHAKFTSSCAKSRAKGLTAKLIGPPPAANKGKPVTISYFMEAWTTNNEIDLTKLKEPLEKVIKDAISAKLVFLIFYEDRGVSLSNFHLASGFRYNSNSQDNTFTYNKTEYKAEYPFGWGTDKAFNYLKKEID